MNPRRQKSISGTAASLLVELVLLLVLLDHRLVSFFEVFGEDDVPVLPHGQHAGLRKRRRMSHEPTFDLGMWR